MIPECADFCLSSAFTYVLVQGEQETILSLNKGRVFYIKFSFIIGYQTLRSCYQALIERVYNML